MNAKLLLFEFAFALVLEPKALAVDDDEDRVMQDTIEHRGGEHAVARESSVPTA